MCFGISRESFQKLINLFQETENIKEVKIYGSRALGKYKQGSDIDIVIINDDFTNDDLLLLANKIDDLLIPYKVDISLFKDIDNLELIDHINKYGVVFYSR